MKSREIRKKSEKKKNGNPNHFYYNYTWLDFGILILYVP